MESTVTWSVLGQVIAAIVALGGVLWTFRGMLSGLERNLTAQNASLNTKIELLQQAQSNAATNLEFRFSNISGALEQLRAHVSAMQSVQEAHTHSIIELQVKTKE